MKTYRLNILTQGWTSHDDDIWKQSKSIWSLEVKKKMTLEPEQITWWTFFISSKYLVFFLSRHSNFHVRVISFMNFHVKVISWNFKFCARANYYSVNKLEKIRGGEVQIHKRSNINFNLGVSIFIEIIFWLLC